MPSPLRRSSSLSPPPLKRRRIPNRLQGPLSPNGSGTIQNPTHPSPTPPSTLCILSWNVNGTAPFLPPVIPHNQRQITKFFGPSSGPSDQKHRKSNGSTQNAKEEAPSLRRCLNSWGWPAVVSLQEVKIAPADTATQDAVRQAVKSPRMRSDRARSDSGSETTVDPAGEDAGGPEYDVYFSLPRDKFNARGRSGNGRVYGVCMLVRRDIAFRKDVRVKEVDWDLEGRVLVLEIPSMKQGVAQKPEGKTAIGGKSGGLAVFGVYAVNGTTLPYRDPSTGAMMGDRHGHKRRFHGLLRDKVAKYEGAGWDVVIAGDINISRGPLDSFPAQRMGTEHVANRADFEAKLMAGGIRMVDSFREMRGEERKYTYRPPGRAWGAGMDRVDLILCSNRMTGRTDVNGSKGGDERDEKNGQIGDDKGWRLVDADILDTEEQRGPSDHVPLYVDVAPKCERADDGG